MKSSGGLSPLTVRFPGLWHDELMSERPDLIGKLRIGSIVSGECPVCHQVILVQDPGNGTDQFDDKLRRALEEHVHHRPT